MNGTNSSDDDDDSVMSDIPELNDKMDDAEREDIERRTRVQQMRQLRRCIKSEIDHRLVDDLGRAFSYFCNGEYQYKEVAGRFVFDIVTELTDEFDSICGG